MASGGEGFNFVVSSVLDFFFCVFWVLPVLLRHGQTQSITFMTEPFLLIRGETFLFPFSLPLSTTADHPEQSENVFNLLVVFVQPLLSTNTRNNFGHLVCVFPRKATCRFITGVCTLYCLAGKYLFSNWTLKGKDLSRGGRIFLFTSYNCAAVNVSCNAIVKWR